MPERREVVGRGGWVFGSLVSEGIGLKLASLLVAMLLWLVVRARQPSEVSIDVVVVPTLDSSLALRGDAPTVRALIAGRTADLVRLYETPPVIHRVVTADASGTLALELSADDIHLPGEMGDAVRVLDVQPRRIVLQVMSRVPPIVSAP